MCTPLSLVQRVKNIMESCYRSSPTFRRLLQYRKSQLSEVDHNVKWNFILDNENYLTDQASCFRIDRNNHIIALSNHKAFAYLGETGIHPLSLPRQNITATVALCLKDTKFPVNTLNGTDFERGISVYLSNKIMRETSYREPIQLTRDLLPLYALVGQKGKNLLAAMKVRWQGNYETMLQSVEERMLERQNNLLVKTTNARRLAEVQDCYLATL